MEYCVFIKTNKRSIFNVYNEVNSAERYISKNLRELWLNTCEEVIESALEPVVFKGQAKGILVSGSFIEIPWFCWNGTGGRDGEQSYYEEPERLPELRCQ